MRPKEGRECGKCKESAAEIEGLKKQLHEMRVVVDECAKAKQQHEKALKYLFAQIKNLAETTQTKKASASEPASVSVSLAAAVSAVATSKEGKEVKGKEYEKEKDKEKKDMVYFK